MSRQPNKIHTLSGSRPSSVPARHTAVVYRRAEDPAVQTLPNARTGAACRDEDPELFFPFDTELAKILQAKRVCFDCPLLDDCRAFAIDNPGLVEFGIWGGMTEDERLELRVERTNARLDAKRAAEKREREAIADTWTTVTAATEVAS